MASETEIHVTLKDGPLRQLQAPKEYIRTDPVTGEVTQKVSREMAHLTLMKEATSKAREGFDPYKVRPRPGRVWGRIFDVHVADITAPNIARPDNAKAAVRHWIETPDYRKLIFEYARGELIRTPNDGEWLMIEEEFILAEEITGPEYQAELVMMNKSILLKVDPLPTHTGVLYDPSARQVQAETGTVIASDCGEDLNVLPGDRIVFIATAGTYCIAGDQEFRIIARDQALGVLL